MPRVYDNTDLVWTYRGDLTLGHTGDVLDTFDDPLRSIMQEIKTRIECDQGEWLVYPQVGANLSDYVGEPHNKALADAIKTRIEGALTANSLVASGDLNVKYMPISRERLLIRVSLNVAPTARNASSETLLLSLVYSYSENNISVVS